MADSTGLKIFWFVPIALGLLIDQSWAKGAWVDLQATLKSARMIGNVEIAEYASERLKYRLQNKSGELLSAKYLGKVPKDPAPLKLNQYALTGQWPPKGSKVLLVVGADNVVSLFAWKTGSDYRFWSPYKTDGVAAFACAPPARPLPGHTDRISGTNPSWDGCLVPTSEIDGLVNK